MRKKISPEKKTVSDAEVDAFLLAGATEAEEATEQLALGMAAGELIADEHALLRGLNPEQEAIVDHFEGPCLSQAVAGCGKTHSVVERIARLVKRGVPGEQILAVTFSKKAADEMNHRLRKLGISSARVGTFHSLCLQILKEDATEWGSWQVDERNRARSVLKEVVGFKYLKWDNHDFGKLTRYITICKANLWAWDSPEAVSYAREQFGFHGPKASEAYNLSDDLMHQAGMLTFDDFLIFANKHLDIDTNREAWAAKWSQIIVDEYQDTNRAQDSVIEKLARDHRNLMVVGDVAQAIYAFRGAQPSFIQNFEERWKAKRVAMVRNYRSGRAIIAAANAIIAPAKFRMPEEMVAERVSEGSVQVKRCANFDAEGSEIVSWAKRTLEEGGSLTDCTVLFRTNAQSRAVEEALLKAKVPYVLVGGVSFYERKEVKDLLGYLRVAAGTDHDGDAVRRCINAPFRYLGKAFVERVREAARGRADWPGIIRDVAEQDGIQARQARSAHEWASLIDKVSAMLQPTRKIDPDTGISEERPGEPPADILNYLVNATQYIRAVEKEEGAESVESSSAANVRELIRVSTAFGSVPDFLAYIDATIKASTKQRKDGQAGGDRVLLMSIHRSKGLEWPKVWVVGCNEMILPHVKGDIEEERRLMYVAVTRARDELVLSYAAEFSTRAGMKNGEPSVFLRQAAAAGALKLPEEDAQPMVVVDPRSLFPGRATLQ